MTHTTTSVLFTGYAPVHFVCFRPLFERLRAINGTEIFVSGGLRTKHQDRTEYNLHEMYNPLGIDPEHQLTVEQIKERDFDFLFAANTKMIEPRSVRSKIQIFHGLSFRNKAVRPDNAGADHYFVVGPYMRRAFQKTGIMPENDPRAHHIGFMKTDRLLNNQLDRAATLSKHGLSGERPVIVYAPTGQKHNSLETMGEEAIARITQANAFDLIIKPHDHPKNPIDWAARIAPLTGPHTVLSPSSDVTELLHAADLLITDASSVSNEFSLLDRPMIFLDVPKLIQKARSKDTSMVDLDTWGRRAGHIVETPDQLVNSIDHALQNPDEHSDIRKAMAQDLFYNPGHATDTALQWLQSSSLKKGQPPLQPAKT